MVLPAGADLGASTSFHKPEWERALSLPDNQEAPDCLRSHVEEELRILFNIGRKRVLCDQQFKEYVEPLGLFNSDPQNGLPTVGFCQALPERVDHLSLQQSNNGHPNPFLFHFKPKTKKKARLYSIMWEYAAPLDPS
uniref:Uncharacterized protein n=1 Tax=Rhizophora mucronata TaxID=61149 RepID=A0A2P2MW42_RHIMU